MRIEDEYLDVLQNIEWAIVSEFRKHGSTLDLDALDAVNALVRHYEAEVESLGTPKRRLSDPAERIFNAVLPVCEWRLGRAPNPLPLSVLAGESVSAAELVLCFKKIRKSIQMWTKEGGRQGYLRFVVQYVP